MTIRVSLLVICMTVALPGFADETDKVAEALYTEVQMKVENDQYAAVSIGYLRGYLKESGSLQETMDRSLQLAKLYGGKNPSLYFLLLECKNKNQVRELLRRDIDAGGWTQDSSPKLLVDLICSYFEVVIEQQKIGLTSSKNAPFHLEFQLEQVSSNSCNVIVEISNQSGSGRYFMSSPDTMDYINIKRIDGVVVPPVQRKSPVVPVFLNSGESIVKRSSLHLEESNSYTSSLRYKYPSHIQGMQTPFQYFYGSNIPHLDINGEIIAFGTNAVPLNISAKYDEEELYSRLAANNFDKNRMPWAQAHERIRIARATETPITTANAPFLQEPVRDWYEPFLIISSTPQEVLVGK